MTNKIFLVPYEIYTRDYYGKLLLSCYLARMGFKVFFGRKAELEFFAECFKNCIYIGLQSTDNYLKFYRKVKRNKNFLIIQDEESLITLNDRTYKSVKLNSKILKVADMFFLNSLEQKKRLKINKNLLHKFKITGNPRFDLYKKKFDKIYRSYQSQIKKEYLKFILVCTSFPGINHWIENYNHLKFKKKNSFSKKISKNFYHQYYFYNNYMFKKNLELIKILAKLNKFNIVIRTHPSESGTFYKNYFKKYKNVFINNNYSIIPWINSCIFQIQYYCTTSIDAYLCKKDSFTLAYPKKLRSHMLKLPFEISNLVKSESEIFNFLKKNKKLKHLKIKFLYNMNNKSSYTKIFNEIKNIKLGKNQDDTPFIDYKKKAKLNIKYFIKKYFFPEYIKAKAPNISEKEFNKDIKIFTKILSFKKNIKTTLFAPNIYEIKI